MNMNAVPSQAPQPYNRFPYDQEVSTMPVVEQQIVGGHLADRDASQALMAFSEAQAEAAAERPGENHLGSFINRDGSFVAFDGATDEQQQGRLRVTRLTPARGGRPASLTTREYTIPTEYQGGGGTLFNTIGIEDAELPDDMYDLKGQFGPMLLIGRTENGGPALVARHPNEWRDVPKDETIGIEATNAITMRRNMDHGIGNNLEDATNGNEAVVTDSMKGSLFGKLVLKVAAKTNDEVGREEAAEFREKAFTVIDKGTGAVHRTFQGQVAENEPVVGQLRGSYRLPRVASTNPTAAEARNPRNGVPIGSEEARSGQTPQPAPEQAVPAPEAPQQVDPAAEAYIDQMMAKKRDEQGIFGRVLGRLMPKGLKAEAEAELREELRQQYDKKHSRPTS